MSKVYLGNAFSLQMISKTPCTVKVQEVDKGEIPSDVYSVIGHPDTAQVLSNELGFEVKFNREAIKLEPGDVLYVAQLMGGRLPEGAKTLPEGFSFKFFKIEFV